MDSANIFFLIRHIGALKHLSLGQWLSIAGAGLTAFGCAVSADPHHLNVAVGAAVGTVLVAVVHVLQPSPIKEAKPDAPKVDSAGRVHL